MNKQPTDKQIKEFWKWCGVSTSLFISYPEGGDEGLLERNYPPIDLNNLFKYAVPKIRDMQIGYRMRSDKNLHNVLLTRYSGGLEGEGISIDPALALFWALWQVKEKSNE